MKISFLQRLSLIISALALLYLLFINVYKRTFVSSDWLVVTVDLFAKLLIEIIVILKTRNESRAQTKK